MLELKLNLTLGNPVLAMGGGVPSFMRGINYSGQDGGGSIYAFPFETALQYFLDKGVDVFRFPFNMERMCPEPGGDIAETYSGFLKSAVDYVTSRGAWALLDPHNDMKFKVGATFDDYSGPTGGTEVVIGETGSYTAEQFADFHVKLYQRFRGPRILHGMMNEPDVTDAAQYLVTVQAAIDALRAAGCRDRLLINGIGAGSYYWDSGSDNRTYMPEIDDDNWVVDLHHYADAFGQGQSTTVIAGYLDKLTQFTSYARSAGLKAFVGEFGAGTDAANLAALNAIIEHVEANPDVYVGWSYWTAVQYQDSYNFQLLPTELSSADADGPYTDRAQMAVLQPYFGGVAAAPSFLTTPTLTGSAKVGVTLGGTGAIAVGFPAPTVTCRWQRDDGAGGWTDIAGATSTTYTLVSGDLGHTVRRVETAANASGSVSAATAASASVTSFAYSDIGAKLLGIYEPADATVSQWTDSSGNGKHFVQATTANQPVLAAGNEGLTFSASTKYMDCAGIDAGTLNECLFAIFTVADTNTNKSVLQAVSGALRNYVIGSNGFLDLNRQGAAQLAAAGPYATGKHGGFWKSGATRNDDAVSYDGSTPGSGSGTEASWSGSATTRLGGLGSLTIHAMVRTTNDLTTTERQMIEGKLFWDRGIQANLPSGHPYKNAAP